MANSTAKDGEGALFFYNLLPDACAARDFAFPAPNNTANGDLCAYIESGPRDSLWACPAGDRHCWNTQRVCLGGEENKPSGYQILCDSAQPSGDKWCCDGRYEICSDPSRRTGVCLAKTFGNPLQNVTAVVASRIAQRALEAGETGVMASVPTELSGRIVTTMVVDPRGTVTPLTTMTVMSEASASGAGGASAQTGLNTEPRMNSALLSTGAIVGIAVGAAALFTIMMLLCLIILRRKRKAKRAVTTSRQVPGPSESHAALHNATRSPTPNNIGMAITTSGSMDEKHGESGDVNTTRSSTAMDTVSSLEEPRLDTGGNAIPPSPLQTLMKYGRYPHPG